MSDATEARDEAIERAKHHAVSDWYRAAERALIHCATTMDYFTAADVRRAIPPHFRTHEMRALGAVFKAASGKWCEPTPIYRPSGEKTNHNRKLCLWRSLVR